VSTWLVDHACRLIQRRHERVEYIAQSRGSTADSVCQVQPAGARLDWRRPQSVLHFGDGMIFALMDDCFARDHGPFDVLCQTESDSAARSSFDEAILGTRVERVLAIHELGVQNDVSLLRRVGFQIGKTLPRLQVTRAGDSALGHCRGQIAGCRVGVFAFRAKQSVQMAVFMANQTHVIHVGIRIFGFRHDHRVVPEAKAFGGLVGFRHRQKTLAITPLDAGHEIELAVELYRTGIECGVDPHSFHQVRVRFAIQIIAPDEGRVLSRQHRVLPPEVDSICIWIELVGTRDQSFVLLSQMFQTPFKFFSSHGFSFILSGSWWDVPERRSTSRHMRPLW